MATFIRPAVRDMMPEMDVDLSEFHHPVSDAFSNAPGPSDGLDEAQAEVYRRQGFVTGITVLGSEQVEMLRGELDQIMQPRQARNPLFYEYHLNESSDPSKILFHALGAWRVSPGFHDLLFVPAIVRAAERLLEGRVRFWHDQVFVKPAFDGGVVEWHQDYSYWTRTRPVAHLTCWIGLDDSNEENGCVHYVPGSHKWELLPRYPLSGDMTAVFDFLDGEQQATFDPVPAVLTAGAASFHHPLTLHGSYENRSSRPRRAAVLNFFRDGVVSDSDEPLLAGVPTVPRGEMLSGQFFPLLSA